MIKHKTRVPSCKSFLARALGSLAEAEGVAVVPQIVPCRAEGVGKDLWQRALYPQWLLPVPAAEPRLPARLARLAQGGSQHSRAEAKRGRAARGAQPLAETAGTVSRGMGCLWHQGTIPCCGEAKLTRLLRPHQSSELTGLKMHRVWCNKLGCCQA